MTSAIDPVALTADLVRAPSVTGKPEVAAALDLLAGLLKARGFFCARVDRGSTPNLYARLGTGRPVFGFNGHVDVVPAGGGWTHEPFGAAIDGGKLYGRGAVDMKSGVAAFVAAATGFAAARPDFGGSIVITITGDEEGDATDGTLALLDWMREKGETLDHCLVGEPTCPAEMGEMIKIGRRGSVSFAIIARGLQGHSAYPHRAKNPLPPLVKLMDRLAEWKLDSGSAHFDPSTLALVGFDVGNPADNVIPAEARAKANIRFNDLHSGASLKAQVEAMAAEAFAGTGVDVEIKTKVTGESFLTDPGAFSDLICEAVAASTGRRPALSTSGGTSDARFMRAHCPVVEFGLVGATMHKADEFAEVAHIRQLTEIYQAVLERYFRAFGG